MEIPDVSWNIIDGDFGSCKWTTIVNKSKFKAIIKYLKPEVDCREGFHHSIVEEEGVKYLEFVQDYHISSPYDCTGEITQQRFKFIKVLDNYIIEAKIYRDV